MSDWSKYDLEELRRVARHRSVSDMDYVRSDGLRFERAADRIEALAAALAAAEKRVKELEECSRKDLADIAKLNVQNGKLVDDYNALAEEREAIRATATRCEAYSDGAWRISMETTLARLLAEEVTP